MASQRARVSMRATLRTAGATGHPRFVRTGMPVPGSMNPDLASVLRERFPDAVGVILQHAPRRTHFHGLEHLEQCRIPDLVSEIGLIERFGAPVIAVTLNLAGIADQDRAATIEECRAQCAPLPVVDVVGDGIAELTDVVVEHLREPR